MNNIVIFGTGDIGELADFYFKNDSEYNVVAFTADREYILKDSFLKKPLVPFDIINDIYPPDKYDMFVALSYSKLNQVRKDKYINAKLKGYKLVSYICSKSTYWHDLEIGDNCFIFEDQTIQPFVKIGNNVTLWSGNHIGHSSVIEDHCFLTSHVVVSGHVKIKESTFVGVNATIRDGITIAERNVIGAGAIIVKDTVSDGVYMGNPATLKSQDGYKLNYFSNTRYKEQDEK